MCPIWAQCLNTYIYLRCENSLRLIKFVARAREFGEKKEEKKNNNNTKMRTKPAKKRLADIYFYKHPTVDGASIGVQCMGEMRAAYAY